MRLRVLVTGVLMLTQIGKSKSQPDKQNANYGNENHYLAIKNLLIQFEKFTSKLSGFTLPTLATDNARIVETYDEIMRNDFRNISIFLNPSAIDYNLNSWTTLQFNTLHFHAGNYNPLTYRYYAQKDGVYDVKGCVNMQYIPDGLLTVNKLQLAVYKNGSPYKILGQSTDYTRGDNSIVINGGCHVIMNAGDYIELKFRPVGTGTAIRDHDHLKHYGFFDIHYNGDHNHKITDNIPTEWSI